MADYADYPRMLHHIVEEPKIVNNAEEEKYLIDRGWSRTPQEFSEIKAIEAKIAYHRAEALRLAERMDELLEALGQGKAVKAPEIPVNGTTGAISEASVKKKVKSKVKKHKKVKHVTDISAVSGAGHNTLIP